MPGLLASKTRVAFRKNFAALMKPDADADPDAKTDPIIKRPAGAIKRPAGASSDAGDEPTKKRPATSDCTAIVPVDDPDAATKDRNKWGFLMRNQDTLDPRVRTMLEKANQAETASIVNNAVRRGKNGKWEFNIDNPTMIEKLEIFEERYADVYDQGHPYEVAETLWGGRENLNRALRDGTVTKVEKNGKMFIKWGGFQVGKKTGVANAHGVLADTTISGRQAIEFSDFVKNQDFGFVLKTTERQVMVEWYIINMC